MTAIANEDFERILARFYGFSDGVVRSLRLRYENDGTRTVELELACRDAEEAENDGWVCVRVLVRQAQELTVREHSNTTLQVLSQGLHIQMIDDWVGIEFGGSSPDPPRTKSDLRNSDAFVIGSEIEIVVGPYERRAPKRG